MEVVSECPLTVGSVLWQSGPRAWTLTVVAKATFALAPELSSLAPAQEPVHERDAHWDDDPTRSLLVATDLVPFKRRAEVMVVGHAHAPHRDGVSSLVARIAIGAIDKGLEVRGDQHFTRDGHLSEMARWKRMPLRWERAAGGADTTNPVGIPTGTDARFDGWGRCPVPNLVPVGTMPTSPYDPIEPIGVSPISPRWPGRLMRLSALGAGFDPARWNAAPLPEHFDAAYFDAAPRDQQVTMLDGTESLLLEHLHPRHPVLTTRLQKVSPQAVFEWGRGRTLDIGLACDTLVIDSDRGLATLAFRGHVALDHPQRTGRIVISLEGQADPRASVPAFLGRAEDPSSTVAGPLVPDDVQTLPFSNEEEMPTLPKRPHPFLRPRTATQQGGEPSAMAGLPFRSPAAAASASATGTLLPFQVPSRPSPALPFRPPSAPPRKLPGDPDDTITREDAPSPFAAPPVRAPSPRPSAPSFNLPPIAPEARAPARVAPAPAMAAPAMVAPRSAMVSSPELPFAAPAPPAHVSPPGSVARSALLGALAHVPGTHEDTVDGDALVEEIEAVLHDDAEEVEPEPDSEPHRAHASSPPLPERVLDAYPIDTCARIAASLAYRPGGQVEVLRAYGLDEATWARLDEHWGRALFEEGERQRNVLLKQHDAAYVAQIEAERGPITVEEYARLLVASERGGAEAVLASLHIPEGANMRIRRVWIARIARDMDLGSRVRRALMAERGR
ncbi:MAG: DUF2169 domain-containing protein [Polyangiaceae bacterium]